MSKVKRLGNGKGRPKVDRSGPDRGTVESKARREWFVQSGTQEMAVFPLGVMYANGVIDTAGFEAGCHYAWNYEARYGRTSAAAQNFGDRPSFGTRDISPEAMGRIRQEVARTDAALATLPRAFKDGLDNATVQGRFPRWLLPHLRTNRDVVECNRFLQALVVVQLALGYVVPDRARSRIWKAA